MPAPSHTATEQELLADDGQAIRDLRNLRLLRAAGVLSEQQYRAAFRAIDRSVGKPCDRCGTPPAQLQRGSAIYCGKCYLETA